MSAHRLKAARERRVILVLEDDPAWDETFYVVANEAFGGKIEVKTAANFDMARRILEQDQKRIVGAILDVNFKKRGGVGADSLMSYGEHGFDFAKLVRRMAPHAGIVMCSDGDYKIRCRRLDLPFVHKDDFIEDSFKRLLRETIKVRLRA